MNKAGFSGKPQNSSNDPGDDIPVAVRDTPDATPKIWLQPRIVLIGGVTGFILLALISGFLFFVTASKKTADSQPLPATSAPATPAASNNSNETVLGHFPYPEAPESELVTISANRGIRMRKDAAQKFEEMVAAARRANVILVPISGFRSVKDQEQLFFAVGAQRNQTPAERAALLVIANITQVTLWILGMEQYQQLISKLTLTIPRLISGCKQMPRVSALKCHFLKIMFKA